MRPRCAAMVVSGLAVAVACGGGQTHGDLFSHTWRDDQGGSIDAVRMKLERVPIRQGADVAIGVAGHGGRLIGVPLAGGARWTFSHPLDSRPIVATGVVVASGAGELFALDAMTGHRLWTRPIGALGLRGAGDDGSVTVVTMTRAAGAGSTLLAVGHDGAVLRQIEADVALGVPAVVAHLAFVPWDNQYVSVLDIADGGETARVLLREKTSHAWTSGGGLYFGELGMFRFDEKIKDASKGQADHLSLPAKTLPGQPLLMLPGEQTTHPAAGAADKIRLYARPTPAGTRLALDGDRFFATYFRLAFGLSADRARLEWVHTHPVDLIGGAVGRGSVVFCDAEGKLTVLDARTGGEIGGSLSLGEALESCVVSADGFLASGNVGDPGPLVEQIRRGLADRDLALASGQTLLLRELGAISDAGATQILLQLASNPQTTPAAREEIAAALANRRSGAPFFLAALEKHYDFLRDVVPAPVGPASRALAAMKNTAAAPLLAAHLLDPADSDSDVRDVAQALVTLASPAELPALSHFFAMYRDAPSEPVEILEAVGSVGEALLRIGGQEGKSIVEAAVEHPGTNAVVRAKMRALLDAADPQRAAPSTRPSSTSRE